MNMPPLGRRGRLAPLGDPARILPSTLSSLHHRRHRRGRAGQSHASVRVDDRNDLASPVGSLLKAGVVGVGGHTGMGEGVGRSGRKRDGRGDLLHWLDLVLQR